MFSSCKNDAKREIETPEPQFKKETQLIFNDSNEKSIAVFEIEIAKTSYEHQTGLMYRKSMKNDQGMLFLYPDERPRYGFYMKNTYIPLDLIYINSEKKMVDFNENTVPFNETPLPSEAPAQYVLEVNAGTVEKLGLKLGNSVEFKLP